MKLLEVLLKEEEKLADMIAVLKNSLKDAPIGGLRISHSGQSVQYYYRPCRREPKLEAKEVQESKIMEESSDENNLNTYHRFNKNISKTETIYLKHAKDDTKFKRGVYIRKGDEKLAHDLAQRDYDASLLKVLEKRINGVHKLIKIYEKREVEQVFNLLNPHRKEIVNPRIITDEAYEEQWCAVQYKGKPFAEGTAMIYTNKGERVRSKSEKIIADMLLQKGVSYRYEAPVILRDIGIVYPDFTVLNVKKRKEIYWEHLGMMDNKDYGERALRKIEMYQRNGIILGKRLIITYETSKYPLETQMIERNISEYCLS